MRRDGYLRRLHFRSGCKYSPDLISVAYFAFIWGRKSPNPHGEAGFATLNCLSGGVPQTPCAEQQDYTDVPLRSFRMPHPTTAHPPLTPLHVSYSYCSARASTIPFCADNCRCLMVRCYLILPKLLRALAHPPSAQRSLLPEHILCVGRKLPQIALPLTSQLLL